MNKLVISSVFFFLLAFSGCVSIYDTKVQVQTPGEVDFYNRNVLDRCTPHPMPHRVIQATTAALNPYTGPGEGPINDQATFDQAWAQLSILPDPSLPMTEGPKPQIDWTQKTVFVFPYIPSNACQKIKPYGDEMTTDCYDITVWVYAWMEGENCQDQAARFPVLLYIYPNDNLPVSIHWIGPSPTPTSTATSTATPTPTPTVTPIARDEDDE